MIDELILVVPANRIGDAAPHLFSIQLVPRDDILPLIEGSVTKHLLRRQAEVRSEESHILVLTGQTILLFNSTTCNIRVIAHHCVKELLQKTCVYIIIAINEGYQLPTSIANATIPTGV